MAYAPNEANAWVPDIAGTSASWQSLITNDAQLYRECNSALASAYGPFGSPSDGSALVVCRFAVPANYDQRVLRLYFSYAQSGSSSTVSLTLSDGSNTDTASQTVTGASGDSYVSLTPSSTSASATPRYAYVTLQATSGHTVTLGSVFATVLGGAPASGVLSSGYESVDSSWYAYHAPVPSGIVHVLKSNPYKIAKDRPNCLFSMLQQEQDARSGYFATTATSLTPVLRYPVGVGHLLNTGLRKFRLWVYVEGYSSEKADVIVTFGAVTIPLLDFTGIGQATFYSQGGTGDTPFGTVLLRISSGSGAVALRTMQILEETN